MNEEALKEFQTALELNPDHAESHFDLARIYIESSGDSASAAPHFRKYVQLRPEARDTERVKGWLMKVDFRFALGNRYRLSFGFDVGIPFKIDGRLHP